MRSSTAARWRATVSSSPRAIGPVSASAPSSRPLARGGEHDRRQLRARDARGRRQPLGRRLQRDEVVRGHRGGRVVGDAVLRRDVRGAPCRAPCRASAAVSSARGVVPSIAQPAPRSTAGRAAGGDGHQRVQGERLARAERLEPRGARAVADAAGPRDRGGRGGDLAVRHAQEHDVDLRQRLAAPERPGGAQPRGHHRAETPRADDGAGRQIRGALGVQFSHRDTGSTPRIVAGLCGIHVTSGRARRYLCAPCRTRQSGASS